MRSFLVLLINAKTAYAYFHYSELLQKSSVATHYFIIQLIEWVVNKPGIGDMTMNSMVTWCVNWRRLLALIIFECSH